MSNDRLRAQTTVKMTPTHDAVQWRQNLARLLKDRTYLVRIIFVRPSSPLWAVGAFAQNAIASEYEGNCTRPRLQPAIRFAHKLRTYEAE